MLSSSYDERCDVWSIGVILFVMLCGYPPFNGKTSQQVMQKIKRGKLQFKEEDWAFVSEEARELVECLLRPD